MKILKFLLGSALLAAILVSGARAQTSKPSSAAPTAQRGLEADKVCSGCHDEGDAKPVLAIYQTRHGVLADQRTPGCQSCHGASTAHVKNSAGTAVRPAPDISFKAAAIASPEQQQACLSCHKGGQRIHWGGSQHEKTGVACSACHSVHTRADRVMSKLQQQEVCFACHKSERAQTHRLSTHPLAAGKMTCSDCHNPHGSTAPQLMKKASVNETCYSCHAERRGPFLWEHEPVTESCSNCHTPHGSNNAPLLKARAPFLCQSCHSGDHAAQVNSGANLQSGGVTTANGTQPLAGAAARAQIAGRACLSCHMVVHGSNHPAGAKLQR